MSDFSKKTKEELSSLVAEKREALRKFRFGMSGSKTKNVREGRMLRRDIARILTAINNAKYNAK